VLGRERFDKIFQGKLVLGAIVHVDLLFKIFFRAPSPNPQTGKIEIRSGRLVYYKNHGDYCRKHPFGMSQGVNTVYAGKGKYLVLRVSPEGVSSEGMNQHLVQEFNKWDPRLGGIIPPDLYAKKKCLQEMLSAPLIEEDLQITIQEVAAQNPSAVGELCFEAVYYLRLLPPQKITEETVDSLKDFSKEECWTKIRRLTVSNLTERIRVDLPKMVVEAMRAIVRDSNERVRLVTAQGSEFDAAKAKEALKRGIWYPTDYMRAYRRIASALTAEEKAALPSAELRRLALGHCSGKHFVMNPEQMLSYRSRPDVSPSEALEAALKGLTLADCGGVCQLVYHQVLQKILGPKRYDRLFQGQLIIGAVSSSKELTLRKSIKIA
jgi:hypothetical protein